MGLTKRFLRVVCFAVPCIASADLLNDASTSWVAVPTTTGGVWGDFASDEPTGNRQLDLLGSSTSSTLYQRYSSDALTGGALAFRVRLGSTWNSTLSGAVLVGIDGDQNGSLDLFVGVNGEAGTTSVRVWDVDPYRSNAGPTSTSIGSVLYETDGTSSNVSYRTVNLIDKPGSSFDLDSDGRADSYLSFAVSFEILSNIFSSQGLTIDKNSPLRYALLTAQDGNIADMGGLYGSSCAGSSWVSCNGLTKTISAMYQPPPPPPPITPIVVPSAGSSSDNPEPGTWLMLATGCGALLLRNRLRRSKA